MKESQKKEFVDLLYNNMNIVHKICAIYSNRNDMDLQQDIIYQLWKSYPSFQGKSKFQTWMYRVALNTALLGKRKKKLQFTELKEGFTNIADTDYGSPSDQIGMLYKHISNLNAVDKAIVFLYLEKCSYEEIAQIIGLTAKNVSVRLVRIKKKLREMFNLTNN